MPGDMNVSNRLVIGANRDLGKTDRLDGHKQIEKTTDQVASEALSKTETVDVFSLIRAKPLPKPPSAEQLQNRAEQFGDNMVKLGDGRASLDSDLETFVPMPSLEQFEEDSKSMSSVKQDAETPKASKMGTAERTGRLLAANLAELGERIQAVASNILGGAKKLYGEVKSAIESKPQVKVPEEVKSDFGKNLYRALSDGSLNSLSHEGIASKIEMIKDESERAVLNKLLDQKIPSPSGEKIESEENVDAESKEIPAPSVPKELSSPVGAEMGRKILDGSYDELTGIEKAQAEALLTDLEKQVVREMLSDKEMSTVATMPKELTKMEGTPGFSGFKCEVDGNLSRSQIRELADKHLNNPNKKERSDALFLFQRVGDSKDVKLTIVMRETDKNSAKADKIDTYDDDIRYNPEQFNYNEVDSEQIFLKFE